MKNKILLLVALGFICFASAGCEAARDFGTLVYCSANQGDINRRCS